MADFKIGDKVRVAFNEDVDKTGIIVSKGSSVPLGTNVRPIGKLEEETYLRKWNVKLDNTHEEKEYAEDILEKILPNAKI